MTNVLIRGVPDDDLAQIRSAAVEQGMSLQAYLLDAVHMQATYLRRQDALLNAAKRLRGTAKVPGEERQAVLDAIAVAHAERADDLAARPPR